MSERVSHIDVQSVQQTEPQMYGQEKSTVTAIAHRQKEPASSHGNCLCYHRTLMPDLTARKNLL